VPASTIASLDRSGLALALRPLWGDVGPLVDRLVGRPVGTWEEHLVMAATALADMGDDERAAVLAGHPRLGGAGGDGGPATNAVTSAAPAPRSFRQHGDTRATAEATTATLASLNELYEERFGFPFVEWVDRRPMEALVDVLRIRLERGRRAELRAGCAALIAIAAERIAAIAPAPP
jgi:2-oxo-4-hydroxy-4-carboxy--5-ureidoimidazoline (OHCU) decarboxylase